MTTASPVRFRWWSRAASCVIGCIGGWLGDGSAFPLTGVTSLHPDGGPEDARAVLSRDEPLYLEVILNRVALAGVYRFTLRGNELLAAPTTLREIGLVLPGGVGEGALIRLDMLDGVALEYDVAEQRLLLDAPVSMLAAPTMKLGYAPPPLSTQESDSRAPGLLLDYDLYAESASGYRTLSAWSEFRMFGVGEGLWRTSAVSRFGHDAEGDQKTGTIRLDSNFSLDFPEPMIRLAVGDDVTGGLSWTRATRLGGIRLSRDFDLQPYRVTMPLARFEGEAVLPSTADLFIEGIQQPRVAVAPGRFELQNVPILSGAGAAKLVLTDITGQQRTTTFSFYSSSDLLQKGLADWSLAAGYLRLGYGVDSFSYADDPFFNGSLRIGASDAMTLESHLESTKDLVMAGLGGVSLVPILGGVVQGAYAESWHGSERGRQYGFGYQWQGAHLSVSYKSLRRDMGFRDVASLQKAPLPLRTDQAFLGVMMGRSQLGASYVRQDLPVAGSIAYASLSGSVASERWGTFSLNLNRDLGRSGSIGAYLYWSNEFGGRSHAWTSAERSNDGSNASFGAGRALPGDENGFGWKAQATGGREAGWQGELTQLGTFGQWRAGALSWRGDDARSTAAYGDASGALLLMEGQLFAMRRVYDAFALVSTDGIGGVPVMLENRAVGRTNRAGYLLVTSLNAWQHNDLSIDPLAVQTDVTLSRTRLDAVPATGSGVLAHFPMKKVLALTLSLRRTDGGSIEPGTIARLQHGSITDEAVVGYDGSMFIEDAPPGAQVVIPLGDGHCVATLPQHLPASGWLELGELPCISQ